MVVLDDLNRLIYSKLQLPTATVHLYNGQHIVYKGSFIRPTNHASARKQFTFNYHSIFDLMQLCASQLRLSKSSFQYSLISTELLDSFLLPYNKFISLSNEGKFVYRLLQHNQNLHDVLYCDPETFNYIFHQSKTDFIRIVKDSEHLDKISDSIVSAFGLLFAGLLNKLNLQCSQPPMFALQCSRLLKLLEIPLCTFVRQNIKRIIDHVKKYTSKYTSAEECYFMFVKTVNDILEPVSHGFTVSIFFNNEKLQNERYDHAILIISEAGISCNSDCGENIKTISYEEIKKIKICKSKRKMFKLVLKDTTFMEVSFSYENSMEMESCLALMDMYFRAVVKSRMLIEPISNSHFDPYSVTYNELNQSLTATNIYNIIDKCVQPLDFLGVRKGHEILRDLGFKVGWYVLFKQVAPHVYPLGIVLNSEANGDKKIHHIRIVNKDGLFWVDENAKKKKVGAVSTTSMVYKYHSLEELMESIKIRVCNKKLVIRPTQIVTEEMVLDLRKNRIENENDVHKQVYIISLFCLQLVPTSLCKGPLCSSYYGKWTHPDGTRPDGNNIRAFLYSKKYIEEESLVTIAKIAELSRPECDHENILKCYGFAKNDLETIYLVYSSFGLEFTNTFVEGYSNEQLFDFGNQIKCALQFLHDRDIVHGFPALHNVYINKSLNQVKLANIGVLSAIMRGCRTDNSANVNSYNLKTMKCPGLNNFLAGWFSQRRIRMLHEYPEEKLQETWDRYVFGCTLWQLFNAGARPLPDKSDQDILDKLEGKDCSWFNGGSYFTLPHTRTDFYNKLQKIICVCVTWGNKDNMVKYEFRKIAEAYEKLADVVNNDQPSTTDFILKAGSGRLDFDVNTADASNSKYTLVEEDDSKRVILVSKKIPLTELGHVKDMLLESEKLLTLDDLQRPDGSKFAAPSPGSVEVEAVCKKLGLGQRVWVKCYSKCKDIPENDYIEEVKHLLRFQHQNIVPLQGCIPLDNSLLLLTPSFKSYRSLRDFIDSNNNTITGKQRESYATQICSGMKYLASNNCVHRNLCLSHVYLPNKSNVVIANFGLARVTEALYYQQKRNLVSDTFVIYPPEVISVLCGGGKVKFRSSCDVWSYGVLLWELYSGQVAYNNLVMDIHGNQDLALLDQFFRAGHVLEPEAGWPPHVRLVVEKCLKEEESRASFYEIEEILLKR